MKKIFLLTFVSMLIFFSCEDGSDASGSGNTLTVNLVNIPAQANGNLVHIYGSTADTESSLVHRENSMAIATVDNGVISVVMKSKGLMDTSPSDEVMNFEIGNHVELNFCIDMDGNGSTYDFDDAMDAVTYSVVINGPTTVNADYNDFHFNQ